jgi:hypothetical protein
LGDELLGNSDIEGVDLNDAVCCTANFYEVNGRTVGVKYSILSNNNCTLLGIPMKFFSGVCIADEMMPAILTSKLARPYSFSLKVSLKGLN